MNRLCIFAKPPVSGKTKSRLSTEIGKALAAEISALMLQFLINEARLSSADEIFLYIPSTSCLSEYSNIDYSGLTIKYQVGSDLGEKMSNLFIENYSEDRNVVLIGSDCISAEISLAFKKLENVMVVIQPAEDGGYILIGMKQICNKLFKGIEWSSASVMELTQHILVQSNISHSILNAGFDIDYKEDLKKLQRIIDKEHAKDIRLWLEKNLK